MTFKTDYNLGDTVYFVTDPDQQEYQVIGYRLEVSNLSIIISAGTRSFLAFEFELSKTKRVW